jgi:hypothetical protein
MAGGEIGCPASGAVFQFAATPLLHTPQLTQTAWI